MPGEFGEFFGVLIIIFYALTVLNYVIKFLNKKYKLTSSKNEKVAKLFKFLLKFIVRYHHIYGFIAIGMVLIHFLIQAITIEISITGIIAAAVMLLQILLGLYGRKLKPKKKTWLYIHRSIAVMLVIAIIIHII
jgi:hypothetical protein